MCPPADVARLGIDLHKGAGRCERLAEPNERVALERWALGTARRTSRGGRLTI